MKELKWLRIKFVLSNMGMVTVVIALAFLAVGYFTQYRMDQNNERMMREAALYGQEGFALDAGRVRMPYFILVTDGDNQVVRVEGQYSPGRDDELLNRLAVQSIDADSDGGFLEMYQLRYLRRPFEEGYRIVYLDTSLGDSFAESMWRSLGMIGLAVWLVLFGISFLLSKWAVTPVRQSIQREKQFVADASHELKTPLTVIMTSAELAQSPDYDEECRERFLSSILTMSRQMRGLIEQMLQLARADQADPREHFSSVDLSKVASEALLPFEPIFFEAGLSLTSDLSPAVQVTGSEPQLRQVLEILLDNARKYSQEGGATQVCLKRRGKSHCLLTVANQGEPISPEALANLFKRFYRADPARNRNGSYGLGLAIAESIVNRHRGKIWAESQNGINTFYVELPCS